jgi:hypothetical protein
MYAENLEVAQNIEVPVRRECTLVLKYISYSKLGLTCRSENQTKLDKTNKLLQLATAR